jgi:acyl-CoA thioester hydrolase
MTPTDAAPAEARRVHVHTSIQRVRWGDMDALGHVNNTLFFRYMEQARSEWIHERAEGGGEDPGQGTVLVYAECEFLAPLTYPATIEVRMYLGEPGRSSCITYYEIWTGERMCASGTAKIVWVDMATGKSSPLPARVAALARGS